MKIVESKRAHAIYIAKHMRRADLVELRKAGITASDGLLDGMERGESFTVTIDDTPAMMFGLIPQGLDLAIVWALATDDIFKERKEFLKRSVKIRDAFHVDYSRLYNYVDVDNKQSIRWLKWLGATFDEPILRQNGYFMRFEINV